MAAGRGMFFGEGPMACPFIALEADRSRRSDEPDHRHRCYAEPEPAPRALAHQRGYCLAAAFTTCPIFQDWAIRSAATPVPLRARPGTEPRDPPAWALPPAWAIGEEDASSAPAPTASAPARPADGPQRPQPAARAVPPPQAASSGSTPIERIPSLPREDGPSEEPARPLPMPADKPAGARGSESITATARRQDVVPAWQWQPLYPRRRRLGPGTALHALGTLARLLVVGFILGLAVVALVLAPRFLGGGALPLPSDAVGEPRASPLTARASTTPQPTPSIVPSPRVYAIRSGDTLFSVALAHGLSIEQLLAANPQITNPNLLQIGQLIVVPGPGSSATPAPARPAPATGGPLTPPASP